MQQDAIFVTGGCGFIGRAVVRRLRGAGLKCVVLDCAEPVDECDGFRKLDITNLDQCVEALSGAKRVVHLAGLVAGPANGNPHAAVSVNIAGCANVFEACVRNAVERVVYASTFFVFEDCGLEVATEDARLDVTSMGPFARSKYVCEQIARDYQKKHKLSLAGLRFGSVYGAGKGSNVVNDFVDQAVRGEEIVIWGEGKRHRQFIYIADIADSVACALVSQATGEFNIAGAEQTTTRQVLEIIKDRLPSTKVSYDTTKPEKVQPYRMSLDRTERELAWRPQTSIAAGIERTLEWFSKQSFEAATIPAPAKLAPAVTKPKKETVVR